MEKDILARLEGSWNALSGTIRELRGENQTYQEMLQERDSQVEDLGKQIEQLHEKMAAQQQQMASLEKDKQDTIGRIEGLLAKFDDLGL